ncbi:MAG: hypothetical protein RIS76_1904 [Verrucomicrobiota bacterium]
MKHPTTDPSSPPSSLWERSSLVRFFRWLFSGRVLRRIVLGVAWVAALIALAYGVENWRGRRAWNQYRTQLEARGVQLDLAALIPAPVADDRNMADTPFIRSWFDRHTTWDKRWNDDFEIAEMPKRDPKASPDGWQSVDLSQWAWSLQVAANNRLESQKYPVRKSRAVDDSIIDAAFPSRALAAAAVLEGLKSSEARLAELREAGRRPEARYPVVYDLNNPWGILLPHLGGVRRACLRLQVRACARLALNDSAGALDDVLLSLTLVDSLKSEPFLISSLVRISCMQIALQPVWEGLADRQWSDVQLSTLQTRLSSYDFLGDWNRSLEAERAAALLTADLIGRGTYRLSQLGHEAPSRPPDLWGEVFPDVAERFAPRGWYQLEKVNYCRWLDRQTAGVLDEKARRVSPVRIAANTRELEDEIASGRLYFGSFPGVLRHVLLATQLLPGLSGLPLKMSSAQTAVEEAAIACALERYRLAEGSYPEALTALVPKFLAQLPTDLLTGKSYRYRRRDDGGFVLYSVGWNEKDDQGVPGKDPFDSVTGDWVWEYPKR